jgi:hypothetical protein
LLPHLLVALTILRYIGIPWVDFIFWEIFMWISTCGVSQLWFQNPSKFGTSEWVRIRKVFASPHFYLPWYLLNVEPALIAWFWRVFILLFAPWRSSLWVFGLQVAITGWTTRVRLGFNTSMLNVRWLVRRLASVGMLREYHQC